MGRPEMPAAGLGLRHEDRPGLGEPVAELGVLTQTQPHVEAAGRVVELASQGGGGASVNTERTVVCGSELVRLCDVSLDVGVRLTSSTAEELAGAPEAPAIRD